MVDSYPWYPMFSIRVIDLMSRAMSINSHLPDLEPLIRCATKLKTATEEIKRTRL